MKKFAVLFIILFSLTAFAQVTPPLPDTKTPPLPESPTPQQVKPVAPTDTAKADYSQEPYIIKDFRSVARFENDGTGKKSFNAVDSGSNRCSACSSGDSSSSAIAPPTKSSTSTTFA